MPSTVSALPQRVASLGDYLPRLCGIATFTHDLCEAVAGALPGVDCYVGAVNDRPERYEYPSRVRFELQEKDLDSYRRAADFLNFKPMALKTHALCALSKTINP